MTPIFVYGTLRPGYRNYYSYLHGRTIEEVPATIQGLLGMAGFLPALLKGDRQVKGELMFIKPDIYDRVLRNVDGLEGFVEGRKDNMYNRKMVTAETEDGRRFNAWVYYWNDKYGIQSVISSGDYNRKM